jgi:hypothetical protein
MELLERLAAVEAALVMRNLHGGKLPPWMDAAAADNLPGLHSLWPGSDATWPPSPPGSPCPGAPAPSRRQVNRIKMIKRQMFGRANFDLLRRRILATT